MQCCFTCNTNAALKGGYTDVIQFINIANGVFLLHINSTTYVGKSTFEVPCIFFCVCPGAINVCTISRIDKFYAVINRVVYVAPPVQSCIRPSLTLAMITGRSVAASRDGTICINTLSEPLS